MRQLQFWLCKEDNSTTKHILTTLVWTKQEAAALGLDCVLIQAEQLQSD